MNDFTITREPDAPAGPAVSSPARSRWRSLVGLLALAALLWGALNLIDLWTQETTTESSTYSANDVTALDIRVDNGSVTVMAASGDTVTVSTEISDGLATASTTENLTLGVLELRHTCASFLITRCAVDYTVEIPADRLVTIASNNGPVIVRGVDAKLDVENRNGRIELDDISGDVDVSNDNGNIVATALTPSTVNAYNNNGRIEMSFATPPDSVTISNSNGSIDVTVPDTDDAYSIDMRSKNGSASIDVRTDPASARTLDLSTSNGAITVRAAR